MISVPKACCWVVLIGYSLFGAGASSAAPGWEELSRQAAQEGDYARALDYLKRLELASSPSPSLQQRKVELLVRMGISQFERKQYPEAESSLREALFLDPNNYPALKALGAIAYYSQRLEDAASCWEQAIALRPDDRQLRDQLEQLRKEAKIESRLELSQLSNFEIRFHAGNADYEIYDIQNHLLQAYREVGYDFNYYPTRPVVVILYTQDEFERLRSSPQWLGGLYDGKIRLPVKDGNLTAQDFKKILWHEYTHALLHDLARDHCPLWLHEGLAQYQEAKVEPVALERLRRAWEEDRLIPLARLNDSLNLRQRAETVGLAYAEAYAFTDYLIRKYGFWRINLIINKLGQGAGWEETLAAEYLQTLEQLDKEWRAELEETL